MSAPQAEVKERFDCRDAFAAALEGVAERDQRIVTIVNDSVGSSKLTGFKKRFPERMVNVGIAEQDMVGIGAGLANGGKIPFVSAAACFLTARALEQIKVDVAYSNTNVKLVGQSPGVAYGELGATHHSIEDMAWLRLLPNLAIVVPSDPWETGARRGSRRQSGRSGLYPRQPHASPAIVAPGWHRIPPGACGNLARRR